MEFPSTFNLAATLDCAMGCEPEKKAHVVGRDGGLQGLPYKYNIDL
jgi:hypothetical protein